MVQNVLESKNWRIQTNSLQMTHINIIADPPIKDCRIKFLNRDNHWFKNNTECLLAKDWFEIKIDYPGYHLDIKDILINHESIKHCIYTGTFTQQKDNVVHYCPSLWEQGEFSIWIHPNLGHYFMSMFSQINNGDYGKNLHELYLCTVDRPVMVNSKYPEHIRSYFAKGYGPRWWSLKDKNNLPYMPLTGFEDIDRARLLQELKQLPHVMEYQPGWNAITYQRRGQVGLPATEFELISQWPEIVKTLKTIGYSQMINANWIGLDPGYFLQIHRDDLHNTQNMPDHEAEYFLGCVRFYWSLVHTDGFLFKMGEAGLLPVDQPMLTNPTRYAHCVINDSDVQRESMQAWGIFDK